MAKKIIDVGETYSRKSKARKVSASFTKEMKQLSKNRLGYYFTVIIPPVPKGYRPTEWHGDTTLSRGNFKTKSAAIEWAQKKLGGFPYSVHKIDLLAASFKDR